MTLADSLASGITPPEASERLAGGLAASQAGDAAHATALFEEALALAPGWHLPAFLLGSEYAGMGDFGRAEAWFARTVLLAPDFHLARYQLGLLQFSGGRTQLAMLTWSPLSSLTGSEEPYPHLVQGFGALARGDQEAARGHLEAALPLAGTNPGLQGDVRRILAALAETPATGEVGATVAGPANEADVAEPSHVLLSNYGSATLH